MFEDVLFLYINTSLDLITECCYLARLWPNLFQYVSSFWCVMILISSGRSAKFCAGASRCLTKWWAVGCFFFFSSSSSELDSTKHLEPWWKQIHWFGLSFVLQWLAKCLEGGVESCISFGKASFSLLLDLSSLFVSSLLRWGLALISKQCSVVLKAHKFTGFNYRIFDNL